MSTKSLGVMSMSSGYAALPMPKVENFCGGVRVSIERTVFVKLSHVGSSVGSDVTSSVTSMSPVKLTERQQVILGIIHRFVVEHVVEGVVEAGVEIPSALSIAKQIDTSSRTVQRELAYLQAQGIIRRVGADFSGHWEIIEK